MKHEASLITNQTDFISVRLLQKIVLKGGRGLDVVLFSCDVTMMVISVCFSWALDP